MNANPLERFVIGAAVGDAIGLPFERLGGSRVHALLADRALEHRFCLGRGMVSDDTEHLTMTLLAYRRAQGDLERFRRALGRSLALWLLTFPPGAGRATLHSSARLAVGVRPDRSGVPSAGNGPVMRAGVLGLLCGTDAEATRFAQSAARITHTDPRAISGAVAIALAVRIGAQSHASRIDEFERAVLAHVQDRTMRDELLDMCASVRAGESTESYASSIGCVNGVTGFIMHTVPVCLHLWLGGPVSYRDAVTRVVRLGGDTDTTAFVIGGLVALEHTPPSEWVERVHDIPMSVPALRRIARGRNVPRAWWMLMPIRNVVFFCLVLMHVVRRLLPPYASR